MIHTGNVISRISSAQGLLATSLIQTGMAWLSWGQCPELITSREGRTTAEQLRTLVVQAQNYSYGQYLKGFVA